MNLVALHLRLGTWLEGEEGQDLIEYGLLVTLVAIIVMVAVLALGPQVSGLFSRVVDAFPLS